MKMTLVVGLGNPGRHYASTRHNAGFRCVERLAERHGLQFKGRQSSALIAMGLIGGSPVVLAKPQTYMNVSGQAVRGLLAHFRLSAADLIVVSDDLDLPLGRIRIRERGGAGGHRGVQSIIDALGQNEFCRLRIGIGRPIEADPIEYVLQAFLADEEPIIELACETAAKAVECLILEGLAVAMNSFNRSA